MRAYIYTFMCMRLRRKFIEPHVLCIKNRAEKSCVRAAPLFALLLCERAAIMRGAGETFIYSFGVMRALGQKEVLFKGQRPKKQVFDLCLDNRFLTYGHNLLLLIDFSFLHN
jgi:hypothetical protein